MKIKKLNKICKSFSMDYTNNDILQIIILNINWCDKVTVLENWVLGGRTKDVFGSGLKVVFLSYLT